MSVKQTMKFGRLDSPVKKKKIIVPSRAINCTRGIAFIVPLKYLMRVIASKIDWTINPDNLFEHFQPIFLE